MDCDEGEGKIWDPYSEEYMDHLRTNFACGKCGRHFSSENNLEQVSVDLEFIEAPLKVPAKHCCSTKYLTWIAPLPATVVRRAFPPTLV
jgi:hypothetical protein